MLNAPVADTLASFARAGSHFITRGRIRYHFKAWRLEERGPETPLLICLHGFKNNAHSFADLIPRLGRPAVALDHQGHGLSGMLDTPYIGLADYAADLERLVQHLGVERVTLIGHSLGSRVAAMWASIFPERVSRLVLIDGYYQWHSPAAWIDRTRRFLQQIDQPDRPPVRVDPERLESFFLRQTPGMSVELARHLAHRSFQVLPDGEQVADWSPMLNRVTPLPFDDRYMRDVVARLTVPTLVLQADPPTEGGVEIDVPNPHIRLERVAGSHQLHWHRPVAVAAAIDRFLSAPAEPVRCDPERG